jgi:hypothetical protein
VQQSTNKDSSAHQLNLAADFRSGTSLVFLAIWNVHAPLAPNFSLEEPTLEG